MLFAMKRLALCLLLSTSILSALCAFSLGKNRVQVQPFDSEKELSNIDFTQSLAPNQRAWVEKANLSLLTIGGGDPLYSWFGHSALIVSQPAGGEVMYDYGVFDPEQKNFYLNFARGRMYYSVWETESSWRIAEALAEDRDVKLFTLELSPEAKLAAIRFLQHNAKEENSTYLYHFYQDNCATRIRDILNAATEGQFREWAEAQQTQSTYRQAAQRYLSQSPFLFWALDFLQGKSIDQEINLYEQMFLPETLHQAVLAYFPQGALGEQVLHHNPNRFQAPEHTVNNDWFYALVGILVALLLFLLGRYVPRITSLCYALLLLTLGVLGSLLLFMMLGSDMDMTWFNENILIVNPLLFLGMFSAFAYSFSKKRQGIRARSSFALLSLLIVVLVIAKGLAPSFLVQDNLKVILLLFPIALSGTAFYSRGKRK